MRRLFIILLSIWMFASCDDASELYDYPYDKIGFVFNDKEGKVLNKTFIYDGPVVDRDTVYLKMRTMGRVTAYDRPVRLEQVEATEVEEASNAVPGVHYIALDDPEWQSQIVVKANMAEVAIPIVLLRDFSLADEQVVLKLRIVENDEFMAFDQATSEKLIVFSDQPLQPALWDNTFSKFFGVWGPVKYRFMLDNTSERWDDEFIASLLEDGPYLMFWQARLKSLLKEENAKRQEAGEEPLKEKDGSLVTFEKPII